MARTSWSSRVLRSRGGSRRGHREGKRVAQTVYAELPVGGADMSSLRGLNSVARTLVSEDFRRGIVRTVDVTDYVTDIELGREIDLAPLRAMITEATKRFDYDPSESDPWLGPRVHATLRLTRREAADIRIWDYLTVVEFPDYVRWRWRVLEEDA